jgi:hypothetical protein
LGTRSHFLEGPGPVADITVADIIGSGTVFNRVRTPKWKRSNRNPKFAVKSKVSNDKKSAFL